MLDASETDQDKLRHLYDELQLLIDRIMAEKNTVSESFPFVHRIASVRSFDMKSPTLKNCCSTSKMNYISSNATIARQMIRFSSACSSTRLLHSFVMFFRKKELIVQTRQKHEDLEFQLMELETRAEAELEQAEDYFQNERLFVTQNSKLRQVKSFFLLLTPGIPLSLEYVERSGSSTTGDSSSSDAGEREIRARETSIETSLQTEEIRSESIGREDPSDLLVESNLCRSALDQSDVSFESFESVQFINEDVDCRSTRQTKREESCAGETMTKAREGEMNDLIWL